jgi:hypothetical protein
VSAGTRWCALCRSEYVAGVVECVECLVPLVDERPLAVDDVGDPDEKQVVYELSDATNEERIDLDRALRQAGIVHAWDAGALVVREADEERTDAIVEESGDEVAYELDDWTDEQRAELIDKLATAGVAHEWDEDGALLVGDADADQVEAIIDGIEFPHQLPASDEATGTVEGEGDGLAASEALSELFVAADRLMHDPEDHEGVLSLVDAARMADSLPLPYGFAPAVWKGLVDAANELRAMLEGDADDEDVREAAESLRHELRQWV